MTSQKLLVRQVKSAIGRLASHKASLKGLGLGKTNQTVTVMATPENLGMISKVSYMLHVEEVYDAVK